MYLEFKIWGNFAIIIIIISTHAAAKPQMSSGARINSSTVKVNSGSGCRIFLLLQRLPQKSSAALHAADTNTRLLSLKTKEHNQWWPSFYQTGKHSLPPTNSNTPHQALFTENNILLIRLYPSLWIYSQLMKYLHRSWRESYNHGSLFLYYTHILCQRDSGEFPRRPSICPSVHLSVCPSPSAHLQQVIYNRCPRVLSAAALQPADTRGRLRYFLIPSAPTEPRQQNSSCAFEVNVCWCDVSSLFVFTFRNCRVFARRVTKQEQ